MIIILISFDNFLLLNKNSVLCFRFAFYFDSCRVLAPASPYSVSLHGQKFDTTNSTFRKATKMRANVISYS